jgi:hypothetical protein
MVERMLRPHAGLITIVVVDDNAPVERRLDG